MDVQQVHVADAQPVETLAGRRRHVVGREAVGPHFRRQKHVRTVDVGVGDAVADDRFVVVNLCRVEMSVPDFERSCDSFRRVDAHRTEADCGGLVSVHTCQ